MGPPSQASKRPLLTPRHCVRRWAGLLGAALGGLDWDRGRRHGAAAHLLRPRRDRTTLGLPPAFLMVLMSRGTRWRRCRPGCARCGAYHDVLVGNVKPGGQAADAARPARRQQQARLHRGGLAQAMHRLRRSHERQPEDELRVCHPCPERPALPMRTGRGCSDGARRRRPPGHLRRGTHACAGLPVEAGGCLIWSHRLIHWESAHGGSEGTCKTLAFGMADASSQASLLVADDGEPPPFNARLALIALRLVAEHHVEPLPKRLIPFVLGALRQSAPLLSREALSLGSATGGAFQRNLVAIHDELLDLASSFAGLAASGTPMATNAQGRPRTPQEQAAAAASARLTAKCPWRTRSPAARSPAISSAYAGLRLRRR